MNKDLATLKKTIGLIADLADKDPLTQALLKIEELQLQIEKMKNCLNCKWGSSYECVPTDHDYLCEKWEFDK